jgi:predicted RNA binding protein YcfA (HicA-like mRNA interferase family)
VPEPQEITAATANCDAVKVREIVRLIEDDGWYQVRQRGSHRQFKHAAKSGLVTVPGKPGDDLHPKTRASILRQAGLTP